MAKKKSRWYYKKDGIKHGPFRTRDIKRLVREGMIEADDPLWKRGLPHPVKAGDIPQLFRTEPTPRTRRRVVNVLMVAGLLLLGGLLLSPTGDLVSSLGESLRQSAGIASMCFFLASLTALMLGMGTIGGTFKTIAVGAPIQLDHEHQRAADSLWRLIRPTQRPAKAADGGLARGSDTQARWTLPAVLPRIAFLDGDIATGLVAAGIGIVAAVLLYLGQTRQQFPYPVARSSGLVRYRDGSPLPGDMLQLTFYPQSAPLDSRTHPRAGSALVDGTTGRFEAATTFLPSDGLICGKHKVTVHLPGRLPLPPHIAGAEYGDSSRTPLEIDTASQPLSITLEKPASQPPAPAPLN
jgi:hypothetical protein